LLRVYNDANKRGIDSDKFNILADQKIHPENYVDKKHTEDFFRSFDLINLATREEEKCPIYEITSSHLARRRFVGNLYEK
jgi:hypothetical protein